MEINKIGILTSGGDAPGMNAAIRAVVRSAVDKNIKVIGIRRGYEGLLSGDILELSARSVSDIIHRGGTFLLTARCKDMMQQDGIERAHKVCKVLAIDALIVVGGDGSFKGAQKLSKLGTNVIGIPATIDLDLDCTDYTIGFDTAVNTGMSSINKIRDTSTSHERCSLVEVMGRHAGHIALWCSLTAGAEEVLIPEMNRISTEEIVQEIFSNRALGKSHNLIIVAEGVGNTIKMAQDIENMTGIETRATILGHLQRGGSPTALDRMHASIMGYDAVESLLNGKKNRVIVYRDGKYLDIDINEALSYKKTLDKRMYKIIKVLGT
ncbi:MAG: 6-phosphofructokinase [Clostridiales bacterium]|jgi:6-phosphofructokinase 1|nr:6-phosphofructokinase [Clostridiales bacterium]